MPLPCRRSLVANNHGNVSRFCCEDGPQEALGVWLSVSSSRIDAVALIPRQRSDRCVPEIRQDPILDMHLVTSEAVQGSHFCVFLPAHLFSDS